MIADAIRKWMDEGRTLRRDGPWWAYAGWACATVSATLAIAATILAAADGLYATAWLR